MDERTLQKIAGFSLWTLSGIMSMGLYLAFAGINWVSVIVALTLSGSLEVGKILSFRRKGVQFKALAICLSCLTLLSILGTTLMTVEAKRQNSLQTRQEALQSTRQYQDALGQETAVKAEGDDLQKRISQMPPDWITVSLKLTEELKGMRQQEHALSATLATMEQSASKGATAEAPTIFGAIAGVVGQDEGKVEVVILMILAMLVELTAFSLVGHRDQDARTNPIPSVATGSGTQTSGATASGVNTPQRIPQPAKVTPEAYLRVALDHPKKPYLLGRGKVSGKLGITETEAKDFIEALVRDNKVRRVSKYFVAI